MKATWSVSVTNTISITSAMSDSVGAKAKRGIQNLAQRTTRDSFFCATRPSAGKLVVIAPSRVRGLGEGRSLPSWSRKSCNKV
jgi:hypothetical protein